MSARSTQFAVAQTSPTSFTDVFTCPSGKVLIVKSAVVDYYGGGSANWYLLGKTHAGASFGLLNLFFPSANTQYGQLWAVLEAGDVLQVAGANANFTYVVSGAVLNA